MAITTTRESMNRPELAIAALTYISSAVDLRALGYEAPKVADE